MKAFWDWLAGKKTYLSAIALLSIAIAAWWLGLIGDAEFGVLLALAGAIAGLRDAQGRTAKLILDELKLIKAAAADGKFTKEEVQALALSAVAKTIEVGAGGALFAAGPPAAIEVKK